MLGLEPTVAGGQEETCNGPELSSSNEGFWTRVCLIMIVFSSVVLPATAVWFWRRLDNRIANNELQQTQTDSFMGTQREVIGCNETKSPKTCGWSHDPPSGLGEHSGRVHWCTPLWFGGAWWFRETQSVRLESSGLSLLTQERANLVLFNLRK